MRRSIGAPLVLALALFALSVFLALPRRGRAIPQRQRTVLAVVRDGQDWLLRHQQADGLWSARMDDPCRVPTVFELEEALSALALLALEGSDEASAARERGVRALLAAQHPDGSFGPVGTAKHRFNWIVPTWALVRLAPSEEGTRKALHRIEEECHANDLEDCEGGWSLLVFRDGRARGLSVDGRAEEDAKNAIQKNLRLHANTTAAIPAMAALFAGEKADRITDMSDLHLLLFALPAGLVDEAAVRQFLLAGQAMDGCARGSWEPDKWWGTAGGRLYSTAMAILILRESARR